MHVSITRNNNNTWEVTALEGKFEGKVVAVCEGLSLRHASFSGNRIVGVPVAIWGAEIPDAVCSDAATIRGLGVGRAFDNRRNSTAIFDGERFVDQHTSRPVRDVKFVMVFKSGVFYRT